MQLRKLLLPGLLSVTLLSGCSLFNSEEDVVKMSPLPTVENQFTPTTAWSTSVGSGIGNFYSNLHPALADNVVYAADRAGLVKALNADDGKEIWSVSLAEKDGWFSKEPALLSGGVTVSGGHVYIGSEKAQVYALNTSDGTVAWQTKVAGEALSRPVVSDGLVLIHTSNGQLQALNEADGAVKWTVNLDMPSLSLRGESAPATAFGAAVVGGDNGRVSAVLMEQGQMIWQQRISQATGSTEIDRLSDVDTTPVVVNGVVFALAYNGNLTALDLRSGQIMWKRELGSVNDFIVDGNRIYLVDQNDRGIVIGKKGEDVEKLRKVVADIAGVPAQINIAEVRKPELDAKLVADSITSQLERRVMFRRAMKRAVQNAMRLGAKGIKVEVSGRLGGAEIARTEWYREGRVPLHTLRADIDYNTSEAHTTYGVIGVKVWIFKGEILGGMAAVEQPEKPAAQPKKQQRKGRK